MDLRRVLAPIPTPFDSDGGIDVRRLKSSLGRWLRTPLGGFVVLGTSGEASLIDDAESEKVVGEARAVVPAGRLFITGTGRESTRATIAASKRAAALGSDAVLVRTPSFYKTQMTTDVFVRHYTAVADASPVPVLLYNFTAVTGVKLLPEAVAQLSMHPNIIGVKESSGEIPFITELASFTSDGFGVLAGSATTFHQALKAGALGGVLALACVLPDACVRLLQLAQLDRHDEAHALQQRLAPVSKLATSTYGVAGLKAALNIVGYAVGVPRLPLTPVPPEVDVQLRALLATFQETFV